jgi:hypothetical protein
MSFFKRLKQGLTSPKARISLQFSKSSFALGENADGSVNVTSDEEFDAKEIRCEIQCVEEARRVRPVYDAVAKREVLREGWESATLYSARPTMAGPLHITQGFSQTYQCSINIPAGTKPTFQSIDSKTTWTTKAVIAIEGRPDVTSSIIELQVTAPSAAPIIKEKEIIREVVMIPCKYCGALMQQTDTTCPHCGAKRTA